MKQIFNTFRSNIHFSEQPLDAGDTVWKSVSVSHQPSRPGCRERVASLLSSSPEFTNISARQPSSARRSYSAAERLLAAEMMLKLKRGEDVRADKVAQVVDALNADEYENALKLDIAVAKLLEDLDREMEMDPSDLRK